MRKQSLQLRRTKSAFVVCFERAFLSNSTSIHLSDILVKNNLWSRNWVRNKEENKGAKQQTKLIAIHTRPAQRAKLNTMGWKRKNFSLAKRKGFSSPVARIDFTINFLLIFIYYTTLRVLRNWAMDRATNKLNCPASQATLSLNDSEREILCN